MNIFREKITKPSKLAFIEFSSSCFERFNEIRPAADVLSLLCVYEYKVRWGWNFQYFFALLSFRFTYFSLHSYRMTFNLYLNVFHRKYPHNPHTSNKPNPKRPEKFLLSRYVMWAMNFEHLIFFFCYTFVWFFVVVQKTFANIMKKSNEITFAPLMNLESIRWID